VKADRNFPEEVRRQHQVLTAVPRIRSRQAEIRDPTLMVIIDQADERARRHLDDERSTRAEVHRAGAVRRIRVRGQHDVARTRVQDCDACAVIDPELAISAEDALGGDRGIDESLRLDRALQVLLVVQALLAARHGKPVVRNESSVVR
jgi:hypothetical protein